MNKISASPDNISCLKFLLKLMGALPAQGWEIYRRSQYVFK
jgi:hypothetical protein